MPGNNHYVHQLLESLRLEEDRTVLVSADGRVTAGELADQICAAAGVLRRHGVHARSVVGLLTDANTPPTLILRYAANLLGANAVHIGAVNAADPNDQLPVAAQRDIITETGATVIAVDAANLARARDMRDRLSTPPLLVGLGQLGSDVVDLTPADPAAFDPASAREGAIAVVTYTSGSTGRPKGVAWTFQVKGEMMAAAASFGPPTTFLVTAPLTHSSGFGADRALMSGGKVVLHQGFDATAVLAAIAEHRVTRLMIAAPQVYQLAEHPDIESADLSSVRDMTYTGSAAAPDRLEQAVKVLGPILMQLYGSSELGQIARLLPDDHNHAELRASVGRPVDMLKLTIRDPQDDRQLPTGERGEVCVNSPWAMDSYWGDPELTARTVRDGWFHTGDLGHLDAQGYLHLHGRIADVIKANGIKVYPAAVESALLCHADVAQAAVFGVSNADRTERIHAVVVPQHGCAVDPAALRAHVAATLSANHAPVEIEVRAELPLIGFGKPDRMRLRADAQARLAALAGE